MTPPENICKYLNWSLLMSTFNTRRDRDCHGKPLPHWRMQYSTLCRVKHIHYADRYGDNAPRVNYSKNPGYWNNLYTTRRRRADECALAHAVVTGADPDSLLWLRPLEYYW